MASNLIEINPLLTGKELVEFLHTHSSPEGRASFPRRPDKPSPADLALASVLAPEELKPRIRVQSIGGRGVFLWKGGALLSGFRHDLERTYFMWSNAEQGHFTVGIVGDRTGAEYFINPLGTEPTGNVVIDIHHWQK